MRIDMVIVTSTIIIIIGRHMPGPIAVRIDSYHGQVVTLAGRRLHVVDTASHVTLEIRMDQADTISIPIGLVTPEKDGMRCGDQHRGRITIIILRQDLYHPRSRSRGSDAG